MLKDNLNNLIMESMKAHNEVRTRTLRAIKAAFLEAEKAPGATGLDEAKEIQILNKMVKQRQDARQQYIDANRIELAKNEFEEIQIIETFLPEPVNEQTIYECFVDLKASGLDAIKKNMGIFIKEIKSRYPTADGKMIAQVVQKNLE